MIHVEVAVHDDPDVPGGHAGGGERLVQGTPNRVVELFHLVVTFGDARVEEYEPIGVVDQVAADHDFLAGALIPVVGDREVTELDTPDAVEGNHRVRHCSGQSGSG